jgi:hypothetical protein
MPKGWEKEETTNQFLELRTRIVKSQNIPPKIKEMEWKKQKTGNQIGRRIN